MINLYHYFIKFFIITDNLKTNIKSEIIYFSLRKGTIELQTPSFFRR